METNFSPVSVDTDALNSLLNSAVWEVGVLITPSVEPSQDHAADDSSEVR